MNSSTNPDSKLKDYIHVFDSIISDDDCDFILNEYANSGEWEDTYVGLDDGAVNRKIRNCEQISLSSPDTISKNEKIRKEIDLRICDIASNVVIKYSRLHDHFSIEVDSGYNLLKYEEGGMYIEHTDSMKREPRSLSCSFILNDDYDGGEFAFFNRKIIKKLKKGSAIVFPSSFMYPHEIMPVLSGVRYSIITWFI